MQQKLVLDVILFYGEVDRAFEAQLVVKGDAHILGEQGIACSPMAMVSVKWGSTAIAFASSLSTSCSLEVHEVLTRPYLASVMGMEGLLGSSLSSPSQPHTPIKVRQNLVLRN